MSENIEAAAQKSRESRDDALERAGDLVVRGGKHLTPEAYKTFEGNMAAAQRHDALVSVAERAQPRITLGDEPTTYGPHSGNSWFADSYALTKRSGGDYDDAIDRRKRYAQEVATWTGAEGRRRDLFAQEQRERRAAMGPAAGIGGELVTPAFLLELTALYRPSLCSFSQHCTPMELPPYGMSVQVPTFSGPVLVTNQPANTGVSEIDPTTGYTEAGSLPLFTPNVSLQTGQVVASTQAFERGGPGYTLDQWVMAELAAVLEDAVDTYTITQVLAAITQSPVTDSAGYTIALLWADVALAKQNIAQLAGTRYRPTHLFLPSGQIDLIEQAVDSEQRPIFVPIYDWTAINNQDDGDTGYSIQSLRIMRDDNIPVKSTYNQLLVSRPATVVLLKGDPIPQVFTETLANNLSVILNLRQYVCVIPRYPNATQVITGSNYPSSATAT